MTDSKSPENTAGDAAADAHDFMASTGTLSAQVGQQDLHSWTGVHSDTRFIAARIGETWILEIRLDQEIPVVMQSPHASFEILQAHAEVMDLGLAVARDPDRFTDSDIRHNALSLIFCRDFYQGQAEALEAQVSQDLRMTLPNPDLDTMERRRLRNVAAMTRISQRLDARLQTTFGAGALSLLDAHSADTHH